jgi:hypothetical protein
LDSGENGRKTKTKVSEKIMKQLEGRTHIRRCHICDKVTEESGATVEACVHCGKPMAPFFFFDEIAVEPETDEGVRLPPLPGQRSPVRGLTAFW